LAHPAQADLDALIQALLEADVEFIVVGGAAAVLHGAPITTQDLDIVHRRTAENVQRLVQLLAKLDATFRGRDLRPSAELLAGRGQMNLSTKLGPRKRGAALRCVADWSYGDLMLSPPPAGRHRFGETRSWPSSRLIGG